MAVALASGQALSAGSCWYACGLQAFGWTDRALFGKRDKRTMARHELDGKKDEEPCLCLRQSGTCRKTILVCELMATAFGWLLPKAVFQMRLRWQKRQELVKFFVQAAKSLDSKQKI